MHLRTAAPFLTATLLAYGNLAVVAEDIPLSHGLNAGPHPVGFRVVHRFDRSREFKRAIQSDGRPTIGERARPMQIGIWYPGRKPASGEPMRYEEYLQSAPFDLQPPGKSPRAVEEVLEWLETSSTHETVKRTLATRTAAYRDAAPAAEGSRPVVIYAASNEAPLFENSVLCEYLASDKTNEAMEAFRLLLFLDPSSAAAHYGLGETYRKIGNRERARENYRKAVELSPGSLQGRQAKMRLEE